MRRPLVQTRRPHPALACRPAREMSGRGVAVVVGLYVLLFSAAALHHWLAA